MLFVRMIKFGIVGGSGVIVNHGVLITLSKITVLPLEIRSLLAIEVAIVTNFLLNYHWTWKDRKSGVKTMFYKTFLRFNFSSALVAVIFNYIPLLIFCKMWGWGETPANLTGIAIAAAVNFVISHFWAFKVGDIYEE